MLSNVDRYKQDLAALISRGELLDMAIQGECYPDQLKKLLADGANQKVAELLTKLPTFADAYQAWYSEAKVLVRQLLPDRLVDFVRHYEKPKPARTSPTRATE